MTHRFHTNGLATASLSLKSMASVVFALAMLLRLWLAVFNDQSNDDHLEVIRIILNANRIPVTGDCWECFQPKLYHLSVAEAIRVLQFEGLKQRQRQTAQIVNCLAGGATLWIVFLFLSQMALSNKLKLLCFALLALNPKFIGINVQATNDSLVILFSTLCLYHAWLFLRLERKTNLLCMTAAAVLSALSKGNGLVLLPIVVFIFMDRIVFKCRGGTQTRTYYAFGLIFFCACYLLIVPLGGQYWHKFVRYGSPFTINQAKNPPPRVFTPTYVERPGTTSIVATYLTFRIVDLLQRPRITNDRLNYPLHRTSLWTQLYARANSTHFDMWPPRWQATSQVVDFISRVVFILALLPFGCAAFAAAKAVSHTVAGVGLNRMPSMAQKMFLVTLGAYLAFIILYTFSYRDFATMKAIFVFPAMLCFGWYLSQGLNTVYVHCGVRRYLIGMLDIAIVSLLLFYCADIIYLICQLM